jgi:Cdc6-like AAA superfamily ATPase
VSHLNLSRLTIEEAVDSIRERADELEDLSKLFVDTNILSRLSQDNDQIIYGRRGTGKTHVLRAIHDHHRGSFDKNRVLPIYIDGNLIAQRSAAFESNPGFSLLIGYRYFIELIIQEIEQFVEDNVTLNMLEKLFPGGSKKDKLKTI